MNRKNSLVIGKFYPPHKGHKYLIDIALQESDWVTVIVLWSQNESISGDDRMNWISEWIGGHGVVVAIQDEYPIDYSDAGWKPHMNLIYTGMVTAGATGSARPTHVYSSEQYGDELARRLCMSHRLVDLDREQIPISATMIRANPEAHWDMLEPNVVADMTKRIVVCGAESSGTTTLTKDLAKYYNTAWVPEYGRIMSECLESSDYFDWTKEDFQTIVYEQPRIENLFARNAGPVMFCDTDLYATAMFYELYLGEDNSEIMKEADIESAKHILYIITDHMEVPFEDDGLRRFEGKRKWQTNWFIRTLGNKVPWIFVSGTRKERLGVAVNNIDKLIKWELADPIGMALPKGIG